MQLVFPSSEYLDLLLVFFYPAFAADTFFLQLKVDSLPPEGGSSNFRLEAD
jgi:hypothetical protein